MNVVHATRALVSVGEGATAISGAGERCPLSVGVGVKVGVGMMGVRLGVGVGISTAVEAGDGAEFGRNCSIEQAETRNAQRRQKTNLMA